MPGKRCDSWWTHDFRHSSDFHPLRNLLICWLAFCRPASNTAVPCWLDHAVPWPQALIVGSMLGPIALLVIFALLGRSHIYFRNFAEISTLFGYAILVSTISFMVYLALLRKHKEIKINPIRSQNFFHRA